MVDGRGGARGSRGKVLRSLIDAARGGVYLTPWTRPPVRRRILPSDREGRTRPIPVRETSGTRPMGRAMVRMNTDSLTAKLRSQRRHDCLSLRGKSCGVASHFVGSALRAKQYGAQQETIAGAICGG